MNLIRYQDSTEEIHVIGDAHISNYDIDHILQKTKETICEVLTIKDISPATINFIAKEIKEGLKERTAQNWIDDFANAQKRK